MFRGAGGITAGLLIAGVSRVAVARGATRTLTPLSDFTAVMPPTQLTHKCTAAGTLTLYWFPGCAPSRDSVTRVYVNDTLVATTTGALRTVTGLPTSGTVAIRLSTLDRQSAVESESTATVVRSAEQTDDSADGRPPWVLAEHGFGGAQLRWTHGGANANVRPANYVVVDESSGVDLVIVDGAVTNVFVPGLSTTDSTRLRLEARNDDTSVRSARNSLVVMPYAREMPDRTPPAPPRITSVFALNGGARVKFTPPADAANTATVAYNIFAGNKFLAQVTASPAEVSGLTNGVRTFLTMRSVDTAGYVSSASASAGVTPRASEPAPATSAKGFTTSTAGTVIDPSGAAFVPIGANVNGSDFIWYEPTIGAQTAAIDTWKWTAIRLNCGLRDSGALSGGYMYFVNNQVDSIVNDYTSSGAVVMIDQHSHLGGPNGQHLSTETGSANDPSGRSAEVAVTDWWVDVARRYRDNPRVWFNLVNEPGPDRDALEAQYRRMLSRIRAVAPKAVVVLDAAAFANDIPTDTTPIGTGPVDPGKSFVLTNGPSIAADFGPTAGYGPIVFSIHFYARWTVNWGPGGMITDQQLADRLRDYVQRCKQAGLPLLIGELGVEAYAETADSACVRVALYERGSRDGETTGVLIEQGIGFFPWHSSTLSGMPITVGTKRWSAVTSRQDTSPAPDTGNGLWDATH